MSISKGAIGVPAVPRTTLSCPNCGSDPYQRMAKNGRQILLIGGGHRLDPLTGAVEWDCKRCGATHSVISEQIVAKGGSAVAGVQPRITTRKAVEDES